MKVERVVSVVGAGSEGEVIVISDSEEMEVEAPLQASLELVQEVGSRRPVNEIKLVQEVEIKRPVEEIEESVRVGLQSLDDVMVFVRRVRLNIPENSWLCTNDQALMERVCRRFHLIIPAVFHLARVNSRALSFIGE
ncbi:hypothetical protein DPMN_109746 [Dreissena polymorpha]|uniref:Uncharacterized protein n=1 Tax=Dreissena polymorpha TaxID=45954 RepID=A0A9D4KB51_DREPO|nr:hypothetical protein DPMN_109746 [Dreissena polymorpha]